MGKSEREAWEWLVIIAAAIILIIAIFKVLFWVSLAAIVVGIVWLIINFANDDHEYTWIPVVLIVAGIALAFVSYKIGYEFEKTPAGNQTVNAAKTILEVEQMRTDIPQQVEQQIVDAALNVTGGIK